MPKNQFTQADFEESVRQRWLFSNPKVAIGLIDWNRKVNAEIEKKQKQEQRKLERQKREEEALKQKEENKRFKQQELKTLKQQAKVSSGSVNPAQSPTKETGAIPKKKVQ